MASSMKKTNGDVKSVESKQLLYPDVFGESYQEDKLRIIGKSKAQGCLQTFSVPQSSVLSQIKSFLPQLSDANTKLANDIEKNPSRADEINIECVDEEPEGKFIEMDLSMIPTADADTLKASDSESDESSDDGNEDTKNFKVEDKNVNKDDSNGLSQDMQELLKGCDGGMIQEQKDLIQLKLPLSKQSRRKHKACIEEIESKSCTYQEDSANG